jgi:ABC-2 type transport system permease protein
MSVSSIRIAPRWKYLSILLMAAQRTLAYRRTVLTNLVTSLIWLAASYYLWRAVFVSQAEIGDFDWVRMRTYILLAYSVNVLLSSSYSTFRVISIIRNGDIANELIRPFDFLLAQMSMSLGSALVEGLFSSLIAIGIGLAAFKAQLPASPLVALLFLVSVVLGFLTKFLINYLVALLCFWTKSSLGLIWAQTAVINILSGAMIPLEFFPAWLKNLTLVLPFQAIVNAPLSIYLGSVRGWAVLGTLGVQALWILLLLGLARVLWRPSLRALEIQGG